MSTRVPLSVIDLAGLPSGGTNADGLRNAVSLAQAAERLGFRRFWVAEHHGMPTVASSAPAVLIAAIAGATSTIRVGSGGVMLPNHPPLVVAEQFGTLRALYGDRIDLGIGRAPGTDPRTAAALRRGHLGADDFPQELMDLVGYFYGSATGITAVPGLGDAPQMWLLGSSGYSAQAAAALGLPFAFAHHFGGEHTEAAFELYRSRFQPSDVLAEPHTMVSVALLSDPDPDVVWRESLPSMLTFLRMRQGLPVVPMTVEQALAHDLTSSERQFIAGRRERQAIGTPDEVRASLDDLLASTGADELTVSVNAATLGAKVRSLEIVTQVLSEPALV